MKYFVYILLCSDDTLYTGFTTDLQKRCNTRNSGKGARYTRARLPVTLVYFEEYFDKGSAMTMEYRIKQLTRKKKLNLIKNFNSNHMYNDNG